jgi:menaquinone-dependent protoporphyrinogen IX oxidase
MKKALIVFYSRSGYTRRIAKRLAQALNADIEEIVEAHSRAGAFGFARSIFEALMTRLPRIAPARHDPRAYETVVIGTPVWAAHVSSPVRTYLLQHAVEFRRVGLFCTVGASGAEETLAEMAGLLELENVELAERGRFPTLALTDREIDAQKQDKLDRFVALLQRPKAARRAPAESLASAE